MGQVSSKLRRTETGYAWWCPACVEMHLLPDSWEFDGNLESPTFRPSFRHTWFKYENYTESGIGIGEKIQCVCHYVVTAGKIAYCGDCTHSMLNQTVDMPELPISMRDEK